MSTQAWPRSYMQNLSQSAPLLGRASAVTPFSLSHGLDVGLAGRRAASNLDGSAPGPTKVGLPDRLARYEAERTYCLCGRVSFGEMVRNSRTAVTARLAATCKVAEAFASASRPSLHVSTFPRLRPTHQVCCDSPNCGVEWFHFQCVGLDASPEGEWLCPICSMLPDGQVSETRHAHGCTLGSCIVRASTSSCLLYTSPSPRD